MDGVQEGNTNMMARARRKRVAPKRAVAFARALSDEAELSKLYAEVAEEDCALANEGLEDYARSLEAIDREG